MKEKIKNELKNIKIKNLILFIGLECGHLLFLWCALGFIQGFTNYDLRGKLIDGPCVFDGTNKAVKSVMDGKPEKIHVVNIHYGYKFVNNKIAGELIDGHLYAGDTIDLPSPTNSVRERFSFTADRTLFDTLASIRKGPEWRFDEVVTVATAISTYTGHLWRQEWQTHLDYLLKRPYEVSRA